MISIYGCSTSPAEVLAGLLLVDTESALLTYVANDIRVGDRVMWAGCDDNGQPLHQTLDGRDDMIVPAYGTVTAQPEGWHGNSIITRDDGSTVVIGRKWLIKVRGRELTLWDKRSRGYGLLYRGA